MRHGNDTASLQWQSRSTLCNCEHNETGLSLPEQEELDTEAYDFVRAVQKIAKRKQTDRVLRTLSRMNYDEGDDSSDGDESD